jgi:hypothetical protein
MKTALTILEAELLHNKKKRSIDFDTLSYVGVCILLSTFFITASLSLAQVLNMKFEHSVIYAGWIVFGSFLSPIQVLLRKRSFYATYPDIVAARLLTSSLTLPIAILAIKFSGDGIFYMLSIIALAYIPLIKNPYEDILTHTIKSRFRHNTLTENTFYEMLEILKDIAYTTHTGPEQRTFILMMKRKNTFFSSYTWNGSLYVEGRGFLDVPLVSKITLTPPETLDFQETYDNNTYILTESFWCGQPSAHTLLKTYKLKEKYNHDHH